MSNPLKWLDERVDLIGVRRDLLYRKMPGGLTWWHTLGSATLVAFVIQLVTGVVLAMFYSPSPDHAYDSIRYLQEKVISGGTLRGIHHWGSSAMVVLVCAHMIRVFVMGAYKYPREVNWLLGVLLFFIVLGFGFTGYLLPWDQKAYWATQVGTNMAGTTPMIGGFLVRLLRGGSQLGAATLARFFAMHVLLLPLMLTSILLLHLAIVVRQGIAPRAKALEKDAPAKTSDSAYPAFYKESYARSKGAGVSFWPEITTKDVVMGMIVALVLLFLAIRIGAGLEAPADPTDSSYVPRPEWYFLPLFQLLKLVPGSMESLVAVGLPIVIILVLFTLPFFDRKSTRSFGRRPAAVASLIFIAGSCVLLIGSSMAEEKPTAIVAESGRPLSSVERAGRALYNAQGCSGCHAIAGKGGGSKEEAPNLTEVGLKHSGAWMHSFMENPLRFHPSSKMPSYGPPTMTHQEIEEVTRYMMTLRGPSGEFKKPEYRDTFPEPLKKRKE